MPTSRTQQASTSQPRSGGRTSRADANAFNDIIGMLKDDHKQVKRAFREFEKLDPHDDPEECQALVTQTCADLEMHTTLEEELFYPAARDCLGDESLIDEAEVEHMSAKSLIAQLKEMSPEDEKFAATFKVLGEYIGHHIKEEENEIFPQLAHAKHHWQALQEEISERREELQDEQGIEASAGTAGKSGEAEGNGGSRGRRGGKSGGRVAAAPAGGLESENEPE